MVERMVSLSLGNSLHWPFSRGQTNFLRKICRKRRRWQHTGWRNVASQQEIRTFFRLCFRHHVYDSSEERWSKRFCESDTTSLSFGWIRIEICEGFDVTSFTYFCCRSVQFIGKLLHEALWPKMQKELPVPRWLTALVLSCIVKALMIEHCFLGLSWFVFIYVELASFL